MSKGSSGGGGAGAAAQTSANTQASALNQIQQLIASMQGMTGGLEGMLGGSGPGSLMSILSLAFDPSKLAGLTGVNAGGGMKDAISALTPFFSNEMQHGIDPKFAQNAQDQLGQQFSQSMSDITAHAAPGQNLAAAEQAGQNTLLEKSANLGGQLAGESQQIENQGAAGLANTATMGAGYNQSVMQEMMQTLGPLLSFISGGKGQALGSLGGVFGQSGNEAMQYSQMANQQGQQQSSKWSSILSGLFGMGEGALTGGAAGPGGLGSILSGGFGH